MDKFSESVKKCLNRRTGDVYRHNIMETCEYILLHRWLLTWDMGQYKKSLSFKGTQCYSANDESDHCSLGNFYKILYNITNR